MNGRKLTRKERLKLVDFEMVDRDAVFDRDGWICGICHKSIDPSLKSPHPRSVVIDHIIPLAGLMGTHEMSNVQAAHKLCNETKSDKPLFRR